MSLRLRYPVAHALVAAGIVASFIVGTPRAADAGAMSVPCSGPGGGGAGLVAKLNTANATAGADTITLARGCTYTFTAAADAGIIPPATNVGAALLPLTNTKITIAGNGAVIRGNESVFARLANVGPSGNLTIKNATLRDGRSGVGGAFYNLGKLTLDKATVASNTATTVTAMGSGGAIHNVSELVVRNSTFTGNQASTSFPAGITYGGAIDSTGDAVIANSTFTNNSAGLFGYGGAIANQGNMTLTHVTIVGNSGVGGAGGLASVGPTLSTTTLKNSIVANNGDINCMGTIGGRRNVIFGDADASVCPGVEGNPRLQELGNNGGPTKTMALRVGSAALGRVPQAACLAKDQPGVRRPRTGACDSGAFERS